jgi:hypothetical protein
MDIFRLMHKINKSFDIPQERIDEIVAITQNAISDLNTIYRFTQWVNANPENLDIEEVNSIYEDFVKSNEHIIEKINKLLYPSPLPLASSKE